MKDTFWEFVCGMENTWRALAIVDVVFLLLLGFSFTQIDRDSGTFVTAVLALIVILLYLVAYSVVHVQCKRLDQY